MTVDVCTLAQQLDKEAKEAEKHAIEMRKTAKDLNKAAKELEKAYGIEKQKASNQEKLKSLQSVIQDRPLSQRIIDALAEVHSSSLVSGLTTHAVNIGSSTMYSVLVPLQKAMGHTLQRDWKGLAQDAVQLAAMTENAATAMKYAIKSARHDQNFIDIGVHVMDQAGPLHAMSSKYLGIQNKVGAAVVDTVGTGYRAVGHRVIGAGDEFVTQLNYRARMHSVFAKELMDEGKSLSEAYTQARSKVAEHMKQLDSKEGGDFITRAAEWAKESANPDAIEYTREMTFKRKLEDGVSPVVTLGKTTHEFLRRHPLARVLVFPFVRTPTWLLENGIRNLPGLNMVSREFRMDLLGQTSREAQAKAMGQMATGTAVVGSALYAALNGNLTGSLSSNYKVQNNAREAGVLPYSFAYTDSNGKKNYIQYNYLDPIAMPLGIAADVAEVIKAGGKFDPETLEEVLKMSVVSIGSYLGNKAYFQGAVRFMDIFDGPEEKMPERFDKWVQGQAGGYVPNMLNQINQTAFDQTIRETRSIADKMIARIPILSQGLPEKRDSLGQPIQAGDRWAGPAPLRNTIEADSPVYKEMGRLALHMDKPFETLSTHRANHKLDLRDYKNKEGVSFYDELGRRMGEEKGRRGKTLHDELKQLINGYRYKRKTDGDPEFGSPRMNAIKERIKQFQKYHESRMLRSPEWKEVKQLLDEQKKLRKENR